jgi:S-(hydroxymethyl)glutathione dehydrogenase/alcohol dehydrogenase
MRIPVAAAVLEAPGEPLALRELFLDEPLEHEVLVRTERVGLCHSDLHYITGNLSIPVPAVLGHEVAGIVERVGPGVTHLAHGERVVATVTPSCGKCRQCLSGRPTQCLDWQTLRRRPRPKLLTADGTPVETLGGIGAFAEAFVVSGSSLAPVSPEVPAEVACLMGCCVSTGVGATVHGNAIGPEDTVCVIGCGGVGVAAIQGARLCGARRIVAVDTTPPKLDLARHFGATDVVLADADPDVTRARLTDLVPSGFTHAIEAVGRRETAELAFGVLAPTGTATVLGLMPEGEKLSIPADDLVYGDRVLKGAYMGANRFLSDVEMFTDHYLDHRLDLDAMVTALLPFAKINDGIAAMADPSTIRIVLHFADHVS